MAGEFSTLGIFAPTRKGAADIVDALGVAVEKANPTGINQHTKSGNEAAANAHGKMAVAHSKEAAKADKAGDAKGIELHQAAGQAHLDAASAYNDSAAKHDAFQAATAAHPPSPATGGLMTPEGEKACLELAHAINTANTASKTAREASKVATAHTTQMNQ